jgi:hypothetical protein
MPKQGACIAMKSFHPQLPIPFDTDWHHQLGTKLAVFPRNIPFQNSGLHLDYWPDLTTFTEDFETTQMMYYPPAAHCFSICVIFKKQSGSWETVKYCDDVVLQHSSGETFESVMRRTVDSGLCAGES